MGDGTSELKGCSCGGALDDFEEGSMPHFRTKGSEEDYDFVPVEWPYTGQTQVLGLESVLKQFLFAGVVYDFKAVSTALTSSQPGGKNWKRIHGKGKYYFKTLPDGDGLLGFTPVGKKAAFEGAEKGPFAPTAEFAPDQVDRILCTRPKDLSKRDAIIRVAILAAQCFDNVEHVRKRQKA